MNWREPKIEDIASVYPPLRVSLRLSPKVFKEAIEDVLRLDISPFIKVEIIERNETYDTYYNAYVKFFYKGVFYQACCNVRQLTTETVVATTISLKHEIFKCMEERD